MDFVGQKLADKIHTMILWFGAAVAFCTGYLLGDFALMIQIYGGFAVVALIVVVPDWPFYNKNPIAWSTALKVDEDSAKGRDSNNAPSTTRHNR